MESRVYESQSNHIKVRYCKSNQFSVCLYSNESWIAAIGINAESHDEALDQFKIEIIQSSPMIGLIVYEIL